MTVTLIIDNDGGSVTAKFEKDHDERDNDDHHGRGQR